ncbi:hypothetical protein ACR77J_07745 [Tissierella praeacuta]|uniref:hypothetical protein n=1 Tax=Tissierella praeacuta TaxID=43131 RepID=UPI003DA2BBA0
MVDLILYNIKSYMEECKNQITDKYECTDTDYNLNELDISNYITEEILQLGDDDYLYENLINKI